MNFFPRAHAEATPDKVAYIMAKSGESVTYRELEERANRCAHLFRNIGLKAGDHIAILMENNRHFMEIVWAAQRSGLIYTPISHHLLSAEVEYIVKDCDAKVVLTSHALREIIEPLRRSITDVHSWLMVDGIVDGFRAYEDEVAPLPSSPIADEIEGVDMLYSSGTTGRPKGVVPKQIVNPHDGSISAETSHVLAFFKYDRDMVYLSPGPLYHSAPLRFCLLVHRYGGMAIITESFDAKEVLALIEKHKVTHSQWVPTMFVRILKLPEEIRSKYDISSMQMAIHGAGPIAISTKEQMIDWWGPVLVEYYAGTEGIGATIITSEDWLAHKGSVGKSALGSMRILDEDESELPVGEVGTIYFAGGSPFEYYNDPERTRKSRTSQGWSTIGDIGYLDENGYLYLTDRRADMVISGGVNIYPRESELILIDHPEVMDVAVIGVPNEDFGEEIKAIVQPRNMAATGPDLEQELIAFCRQHISKIKCPVSVDFRETLPRTPTGKLLKKDLKEEYSETGGLKAGP